jgi:hypothetical protein
MTPTVIFQGCFHYNNFLKYNTTVLRVYITYSKNSTIHNIIMYVLDAACNSERLNNNEKRNKLFGRESKFALNVTPEEYIHVMKKCEVKEFVKRTVSTVLHHHRFLAIP